MLSLYVLSMKKSLNPNLDSMDFVKISTYPWMSRIRSLWFLPTISATCWLLTEHNNISVETEKDPATGGEVLEDDHSTFRTKEKAPQTIAVVYRGSCLKVRAEALTNSVT